MTLPGTTKPEKCFGRRVWGRIVAGVLGAFVAAAAFGGDLDPTFGENGRVRLSFASASSGFGVVEQSDGKLLIAGSIVESGEGGNFAVARLNANGSIDTEFGTNGFVAIDFNGSDDTAYAVAEMADGSILAAGGSGAGAAMTDAVVVRFDANGALDTTFGTNGSITRDFGGADNYWGIDVESNGDFVLLAGTDANGELDAVFVRYLADGSIDLTFGTNGETIVDAGGLDNDLGTLVRQADGKLLGCGILIGLSGTDYHAARLNPDGSPDVSFGLNGVANLDLGTDVEFAGGCSALADGSVLLAGAVGSPGAADLGLVKLGNDGVLDTAFGNSGSVVTDVGGTEVLVAVEVLQDGRIAVAGFTEEPSDGSPAEILFAVFDANGAVDTSFGQGGIVRVDFGHNDAPSLAGAWTMRKQADDKLLAIGTLGGNTSAIGIARADANGVAGPGVIGFYDATQRIAESGGSAIFTVRRTGGDAGMISVDYTTVDGTAQSQADFTSVSGTLDWGNGDVDDLAISVPISDDTADEPAESFSIVLSNAGGGAVLAATNATVTINDDDNPPPPPPPSPSGSSSGGGAIGPAWLLITAYALWRRRRFSVL